MTILESPQVLVSILNYNSYENTVETIKSYLAQNYQNLTLQVIDNASTDDCVNKIQEVFPDLKIICLSQNTGYVGGNNAALEQGLRQGYDLVIISNEDIEVEPNFVSNLVETALKTKDAGIIGAVEINYFSRKVTAWASAPFNFWLGRNRWKTDAPKIAGIYRSPYVQGAAVAFTRAALERNIRLDNRLFIYVDEIDLGLSLERSNLGAYVDTRCKVYHKCRPQPFNTRQGYLIQRNRIYLVRKYGSRLNLIVNILIVGLIELPIKSVVRLTQRRYRFVRACWLGYFDGIRGYMNAGRFFSV